MACSERVIALIDMDCFYVQVEQRRCPSLRGKPCAVVQYNKWKGGGIIAVSYEARDYGVTRSMRGDDAKEKCPDIELVQVPVARGKANLTPYREAGAEVIEVLSRFCESCERASVDEAYLDLTDIVDRKMTEMDLSDIVTESWKTSFIEGFTPSKETEDEKKGSKEEGLKAWRIALEDDPSLRRLAIGAIIMSEIRKAVLTETTFTCSAGVAANKMLAKLACGLHKPNQQTILPMHCVPELFKTVKLKKIRNLGGKLGLDVSASLNAEYMGDIAKYSLNELKTRFGDKTGEWIHQLSHGIDNEPVRVRQLPKSVGCGKNFPGTTKLATVEKVRHWLTQLVEELHERLTKEVQVNDRQAKSITVGLRLENSHYCSRSCPIRELDVERIFKDIYELLLPFRVKTGDANSWKPAIMNLSLSAGKFTEKLTDNSTPMISTFFTNTPDNNADGCNQNTDLTTDQNTSTITRNSPEKKHEVKNSNTGTLDVFLSERTRQTNTSELTHSPSKQAGILKFLSNNSSDNNNEQKCVVQKTTGEIQSRTNESPRKTGIQAFFVARSDDSTNKECNNINDVKRSLEITDSVQEACGKHNGELGPSTSTSFSIFDPQIPSTSKAYHDDFEDKMEDEKLCEDVAVCEKCGDRVSTWNMPEHLDFHFAKELQEQEEREGHVNRTNEPPRKKHKTSGKIHSFFSSSNTG
ncbi:DNA polymerase eta-like [Actinia tenebrosa]|uniref:DNA polymerase eta n=1 Tax=Actinia tenebrosa TaxID=6105 RepID=A0A6P8ILR4_ACTTE|nr:DNA polymerase eta-like [Actinia tenebrosa]